MILSYVGYDIHPLTYLHMAAEMVTIHGTGIVPENKSEMFEIFKATNFVYRFDVAQYRRIAVLHHIYHRIDVSQYRRIAVLQHLRIVIVASFPSKYVIA